MKLAVGIRESPEAPTHTQPHTHTHTRADAEHIKSTDTHVVGANFKGWARRKKF